MSEKLESTTSRQLTLFAAGSPVKMFLKQEPKKEYLPVLDPAFFFRRSELFGRFDRDGLLLRMFGGFYRATLEGTLEQFSGNFPESGMMQNGKLHQLPSLVFPTSEKGFSYLPTPQVSDADYCTVQRQLYLRGTAYRIRSNQGVDGSAKMADIALNVWGGVLHPRYVEAMMGFPKNWSNPSSNLEHSETP